MAKDTLPMPIRTLTNQYRGINAHLHSQWQASGGWDEFHTAYIVYLANALKAALRPLGYTASIEQSLQIRRQGFPISRPESDVTIYDPDLDRAAQPPSPQSSAVAQVIPVLELLQVAAPDLAQYKAVAIHGAEKGTPVAWVELLSPSNKPGGQDAAYYDKKRLSLLHTGIVFVELDYLHESPPTFEGLPNYRSGPMTAPATPYRIVVIDPRPAFESGKGYIYGVDVDSPLPTVVIPLSGADQVAIDLDSVYQRTFQDSLFGDSVDYAALPVNFTRYRPADQARIVARMVAVLEAHERGERLDSGVPLPTQPMSLADGLQRLPPLP